MKRVIYRSKVCAAKWRTELQQAADGLRMEENSEGAPDEQEWAKGYNAAEN